MIESHLPNPFETKDPLLYNGKNKSFFDGFMGLLDIETAFSKALLFSFSKRKLVLSFSALFLCGVIATFCRAIGYHQSSWISMSLFFLPILLSSGILLALGVLLIRIHMHEVKSLNLSLKRLFSGSIDLILGTMYLSLPPIIAYLFLWVILGFFYLLREIPGVGDFFSVVFAFGPFLLIFGSILLCIVNFALLFFVAPVAAFQPLRRFSMAKRMVSLFRGKILSSLALFILAMTPILFISALLILSALLAHSAMDRPLSIALEWFFIMIPFAALLSPAVVFFFNFAAEAYQLLQTNLRI